MLACAVDPHTAGVAVVDAYNGQDQTNRRDVIQVDPRTVKHACRHLTHMRARDLTTVRFHSTEPVSLLGEFQQWKNILQVSTVQN